jgi:hypothetical protein
MENLRNPSQLGVKKVYVETIEKSWQDKTTDMVLVSFKAK